MCLFAIHISSLVRCLKGFLGGSDGKESTCHVGDLGSIPGSERSPGEGHGNPLQYAHLENPHGQRSLVGCGPWGHKESDTTECLSATNPVTNTEVCTAKRPLEHSTFTKL